MAGAPSHRSERSHARLVTVPRGGSVDSSDEMAFARMQEEAGKHAKWEACKRQACKVESMGAASMQNEKHGSGKHAKWEEGEQCTCACMQANYTYSQLVGASSPHTPLCFSAPSYLS
eukprot:353183-Chlamydomonas_euryale.AAC.17